MAQNNSNKFSGINLTPSTSTATNTVGNSNPSASPSTYTPNLHTDNLAVPLFLQNPPGILKGGSENRKYVGWYHKLNTGEYRTGKIPYSNTRQQSTVIKGVSRSNSKNRLYNGTTGYYDYVEGEESRGYIRAKSDQLLIFEDQEEILDSGYNGEAGSQEPGHINYIVGNMIRYFARKRNTQIYQEINSTQFDNIGTNNPWSISSPIQEDSISENKMNVWLIEAGGLTEVKYQSSPDPKNPTSYIKPNQSTFSYNGPDYIWSDGKNGTSPKRLKITNLKRDKNLSLERSKSSATIAVGAQSPQGDGEPWPMFMGWFKNHEGFSNDYDDELAFVEPYLILIDPKDPLSGNAFYRSSAWLLSPQDWKAFSKYFVCTLDAKSGGFGSNAISLNGNINPGTFYDKSYPKYSNITPILNRVDLKSGKGYTLNSSPNSNTKLSNGDEFYFIYSGLQFTRIWSLYYQLSQSSNVITDSKKRGYILGQPTSLTASLYKWVPEVFTDDKIKYPISGVDRNGQTKTTETQNGGTGEPLFDRRGNYRGYTTSVFTIYQYTGMDKPSNGVDGNPSKYDNFYYFLPPKNTKLFKEDKTPIQLRYEGDIFEVYKDCQAAVEYNTTIFSGKKPSVPTLNSDLNRTTRITNKPLYNKLYFQKYILNTFQEEGFIYLDKIGITPSF
jgi:hypothetical protein